MGVSIARVRVGGGEGADLGVYGLVLIDVVIRRYYSGSL